MLEPFTELRTDITALALGCYIAECLDALAVEDQPDAPLMQLGLNSLYALSKELYPQQQIKAAFELRAMCIAGYTPELFSCAVCGKKQPDEPYLSLASGRICCRACRTAELGTATPLCGASLAAMRYIVTAPAKQLFSFTVEGDAQKRLWRCGGGVSPAPDGRRFSALDYYKNVRL